MHRDIARRDFLGMLCKGTKCSHEARADLLRAVGAARCPELGFLTKKTAFAEVRRNFSVCKTGELSNCKEEFMEANLPSFYFVSEFGNREGRKAEGRRCS
jgi:hypothetical protein